MHFVHLETLKTYKQNLLDMKRVLPTLFNRNVLLSDEHLTRYT
jgi:hypothetical protein